MLGRTAGGRRRRTEAVAGRRHGREGGRQPARHGRPPAEERPAEGQGESPPRRGAGSPRNGRCSRAGPSISRANWPPPARRPSASPRRCPGPRASAAEAGAEIQSEWGATLDAARLEAEKHGRTRTKNATPSPAELKRFGDVNLLAVSQEEGLRERHQFVSAQRADAEAAATELNRIIQSVDGEIESRFSETFGRVRRGVRGDGATDACGIFWGPGALRGGGGDRASAREEGLAAVARPVGGGAGVARAIVPVQRVSEPAGGSSAAFCILDEAEAALDDLNLARFLSVVDSHRANGQYLLVTHQKRTMAAADVLYGVVQDASGATTVVSKRLQGE